jgi:flagellar basal-body rod modification protein FlgD
MARDLASEDELMAGTTTSVADNSALPEAIRKLMKTETKSEGPKNALGKDDFLKLMLTELKFQDPLNMKEDKEFIAQLAQFSSLEQTTKLADNLGATMQFQQLSQVSGLVGMPVEVNDFVNGKYKVGIVEEARLIDGKTKIKIGETMYDPSEIRSVLHPGAVTPASPAAAATANTAVQTAVSGQ